MFIPQYFKCLLWAIFDISRNAIMPQAQAHNCKDESNNYKQNDIDFEV